jgi:DNA mismatch repair protein MutS2
LAIAQRLGLDQSVLDEAISHIGASSSNAEVLLATIYEMREKIAAQEAGTRLALKQAQEMRETLLKRLENIENDRQVILEQTRHIAESELEEIRVDIRAVRKKLRDAESKNKLKKLQKMSEEIEEEKVSRLDRSSQQRLLQRGAQAKRLRRRDLQVGDKVFIGSLGAKGEVVSLGKKEAGVAVGRLHMRAAFDDLELRGRAREEERETEAAIIRTPAHTPARSPGMELDLRGMRVEDSLGELDRYLDAAFLSDLPWVRIIHGKGTGRLRTAVRDALAKNDHVLSWEEGKDGEGGAGVTVVKLMTE